jgi:fructan beta-fructosidase
MTLLRLVPVVLGASGLTWNLFAQRPEILIADFEGTNYGTWKATGEAFGPGPARGTLPNQMPVDGFRGRGLVNSFFKGDGTTGSLTSPPFKIERDYLQFLIGGGKQPGQTCLNLLLDGRVVRTATGPNDKPGGSERLDWGQWEVRDLAGRTAVLEIVDRATGGWGHINVDHIVQTDRRMPGILTDATRQISVEKRYLNLPVKHGAPKRRVSFAVDGRTAREFEIELADGEPDFWVFLDLAPFQGRQATIKVDRLREDSAALNSIEQAAAIKGAGDLYREKLRPQFHFSSRRGWNNDPNGLVFYQGEYHLFYQHNPYGWDWGNMHWGHAVSADLVHWVELPIAIYPYRFGDWVFSGSAVVDWQNTAGFKTGNDDVLVAAYTSTGRGEAIAFSNDRGRTWTDFSGNPVVKHEGRDPRLFWHAATRRWVMAVYDEAEGKRWIAFYTSPDLKAWQYRSRIEGFFECPDIFELPVDGAAAKRKWVLTAASSEYRVGEFDGTQFKPETPKLPGHRGSGFYAAQTYSDIPAADGRRIQIGWGQVATPGMPFNQMMFFPCALTLRSTPAGPRLAWQPVKQIERLRTKTHQVTPQSRKPGEDPLANLSGELFDLRAEFEVGAAAETGLRVRGTAILYDSRKQELVCRDRRVPLMPVDGKVRLRVLVDRTSLEIFADDGLIYMPMPFRSDPAAKPVVIVAQGGEVRKFFLEVSELKSIWPPARP